MAELPELIKVSKHVKTILEDIKEKEGHSSLDSVIRGALKDQEAYLILKKELERD
jgi:hypothetical protein